MNGAARSWLAAAFALIVALGASAPLPAQTDWTKCADEGGTCTVPAQRLVRYGEPFTPRWTAPRTVTGSIACDNATWGDPAPSTGKQCQSRDWVPTGVLPPLTSGERYVVSWTQPTTNTDGSPIKPITATRVHASTSSSFATYYEWIASTPGATSVVVLNGPTGTVYWRASVETADGVSDYSATAITEREYVARQRPLCWGKPIGTGSWVKVKTNAEGWAAHWQCTTASGVVHQGRFGLWSQMASDWAAQFAAALPGGEQAFNELWDRFGAGPSVPASTYDPVRPLYAALVAENPLPAAPAYRVAVNSTLTTRPAYALVAGARTSTTIGRVAVGAPCDCTAFKSGDYCAVTGQPNLATAIASDVLPASAAVCRAP